MKRTHRGELACPPELVYRVSGPLLRQCRVVFPNIYRHNTLKDHFTEMGNMRKQLQCECISCVVFDNSKHCNLLSRGIIRDWSWGYNRKLATLDPFTILMSETEMYMRNMFKVCNVASSRFSESEHYKFYMLTLYFCFNSGTKCECVHRAPTVNFL